MNNLYRVSIAALGGAIWLWGGTTAALASDNSATVLPTAGYLGCHNYAAGQGILSMLTRAPGESGSLDGPENPEDNDASGESADYKITDNGTRLSFSNSTTPIDFAVIKYNRHISLLMYPSGGVTSDANMTATVNGKNKLIQAFALCYGLGNEVPPPTTLKSCDFEGMLDETGISCPETGERALVCNFELDVPFYGTADGSDTCCVCNNQPLPECDPNVVAGDTGACTLPKATVDPTLRPTEVTTHIEINNDPYYCLTAGGKRKCYKY